jgi:uncharacterized peroxidase-related enzyme
MPRISPIDPDTVSGPARQLLDTVQADWGMIPNLVGTLAHAPVALEGYLGLSEALSSGVLSAELREQIAVTVAEANRCDYCLAAHSAVAATVGLSKEAVMDARRGVSPDRKVEVVLHFARQIVQKRGCVDDDDVGRLRDAGFGDREIVEIVTNVAMSILTNYVNHVAGTDVDFPLAPQLSGA